MIFPSKHQVKGRAEKKVTHLKSIYRKLDSQSHLQTYAHSLLTMQRKEKKRRKRKPREFFSYEIIGSFWKELERLKEALSLLKG